MTGIKRIPDRDNRLAQLIDGAIAENTRVPEPWTPDRVTSQPETGFWPSAQSICSTRGFRVSITATNGIR